MALPLLEFTKYNKFYILLCVQKERKVVKFKFGDKEIRHRKHYEGYTNSTMC